MENIKEGEIIYMVFVSCLKEDIQCKHPMKMCKGCVPTNFEAHISRVVYTADKKPLIGIKYFVDRESAEARKVALTNELAAIQ